MGVLESFPWATMGHSDAHSLRAELQAQASSIPLCFPGLGTELPPTNPGEVPEGRGEQLDWESWGPRSSQNLSCRTHWLS
jgi:hypothetical protein